MKLVELKIHNIRSIKDATFSVNNYGLLIGENNAGKTNVITALRLFYGEMTYNEQCDFPKFSTEDKESWVELLFDLEDREKSTLEQKYKLNDNQLRVRRYFQAENRSWAKSNQSNIYYYTKEGLSQELFCSASSAKNISQYLGQVIYIPDVSKSNETLKLSGPSPFRDLVTFVMKQVVDKSEAFSKLEEAFGTFKKQFRQEATSEGHSIEKLEEDINKEVQKWNISFGIDMSSIKTENIIKNFLTHYIADSNLEGEHVSIDAVGQGLQRHLIYTLIKLSAQYKTPTTSRKNKFLPDFTLILFEEPELFLHPSQQKVMNQSLQSLANNEGQQVLITTHSTEFVSRNVFDLTSLIRVSKPYMKNTCLWQLDRSTLNSICDKNFSLSKIFTDLLKNENTNEQLKNKIKDKKLGDPNANEQEKLNEEHIRYFLWLDTERTAAFFAKHVLICEGASEKIAIEYLIANQWSDLIEKHIYVLDAMGKYNIHRYMSLFEKLGITHSVLMDKDKDNEINNIVNDFIRKKQHNQFTIKIHMFDKDLEDFLNIEKPNRNDAKPLHILKLLSDKEVDPERIKEFRSIINQLLGLP